MNSNSIGIVDSVVETGGAFVNGQWMAGEGPDLQSISPTDDQVVWSGRTSSTRQVDQAFEAARRAQPKWGSTTQESRIAICRAYAAFVKEHAGELATLISQETGKTLWESRAESGTVAGKIELSIDSIHSRRDTQSFEMSGGMNAVTRFKPHGVLGILGPFNFPAHLPNGHIVPAIMAGNTVVFKPSEMTPAVGAWMAAAWQSVGLPAGVLNLVQGTRDVGIALANHSQADGLLFTGSSGAGRALHRAFAEHPQKILALEMGGNNPLVVHQVADLNAAAYLTILSAYITAGQRCTCARRLIVVDDRNSQQFLDILVEMIGKVSVGYYSDTPEPFIGTVISRGAGTKILGDFERLVARGGRALVSMKSLRGNPALLSPGLVDVSSVDKLPDEEVFGPLLTVKRVATLDEAIAEANNTSYGLSAGLLSDDRASYERFIQRIRAGIVNWNRQTTGASGKLPFGGCGMSGNHRPAGFYSADYCSFAVGSLEAERLTLPEKLETGINL